MNPLVISELDTLGDTEAALRAVRDAAGAPLQLNKDSVGKRKGALHDAARLQLLLTWARSSREPYLHFHSANSVDTVLSELCDYAPGIAALRLASGVKVGEAVVPRRIALERATEKMQSSDAQELSRIIKGRCIDLTCVSGSRVQYLRPLFSARRSDAVKRSEGMHQLLRALSEHISKYDASLVPDGFLKACSIFASELFGNTQEHAIRDHRGAFYLAHVEGLIVSWTQMDEAMFGRDFQGHPRLARFWDEELAPARDGATRALRCLQLSFFDSGPGFASRATGRATEELSLADERAALLNCLQKNVTTKREAGAGGGLPAVLSELKQIGGLLRIRSGRHAVFNVFDQGEGRDLFEFSDWARDELAPVTGAVITLLVPLRKAP
ncbi:hypothetical protein [Burkholderia pseudomallei]|uniref:hypothetical protein n=1 Tax=Burkholderia pseudomallei TaxID=28450 RepID=UPI00048CCF01|nr:hypothetical protein [Burkholderia pseudomallei]